MNKQRYLIILLLSFCLGMVLSSCSIVQKISGTHIDPEQYEKAREAKMLALRLDAATKLSKKIEQNQIQDKADITIYLTESLLNQIVKQYESMPGWLDESTSYIIKKATINLFNGSAIVSLDLNAHNLSYDVNLELTLDCIMTIELQKNELIAKLEPYNVAPVVTAGGILSSTEDIIKNLIKKNLAELDKNFPPLKMPVDFSNSMDIAKSTFKVDRKSVV